MNFNKFKMASIITFSFLFNFKLYANEIVGGQYADFGLRAYQGIADKLQQYRGDRSRWDSLIRKFRKDHNLSLTLGLSKNDWHISNIDDRATKNSSSYYGSFQYCFHIPIYKRLGYFLGSNIGYEKSISSNLNDGLRFLRYYDLPGLIAGVTWNVNSYTRLNSSIKGNLVRGESLEYFNTQSELYGLSHFDQNGIQLSYDFSLDLFVRLEWGLKFESQSSVVKFDMVNEAPNLSQLSHSFSKVANRYGVGVIVHII